MVWLVLYVHNVFIRLCGRMPFNGDTASRLETEIMLGEIKFREPEWISIGEPGMETYVHLLSIYLICMY